VVHATLVVSAWRHHHNASADGTSGHNASNSGGHNASTSGTARLHATAAGHVFCLTAPMKRGGERVEGQRAAGLMHEL
jgi:hypothetical protein